ncbi:MAG TPA: hypothetical protein VEN81_05875 [Planctomycetota bacterium]|nr:hypothetical protein [Planctomycetota bacterium]
MRLFMLASAFLLGAQDARPPRSDRPGAPQIKGPVMFDTPEADAILGAMQIFPRNSPWNEDISGRPVHPDSEKIIVSIGKDRRIGLNRDMSFILVPGDQKKVDVRITQYPNESDKGPFPVPDNAPIEDWPLNKADLEEIQKDGKGDRHVIVLDVSRMTLYEFWRGFKKPTGWEAACEATFDLTSNALRPAGWTSSDAAGLPIFPALPRYDECERGKVEHALRFTVRRSRKEAIYPATHHAGRGRDSALPAMGQRLRLKASVDVEDLPKHARAIAEALKKYGMFVADNGMDWLLSTPPDRRLQGLDALRRLHGSDFEVVQTTGEKDLGR